MIFYHFLIHNFPPEILTEKKKFSQFHLKDFPYNIWMLMSLWEFFSFSSQFMLRYTFHSTSNVTRHQHFPSIHSVSSQMLCFDFIFWTTFVLQWKLCYGPLRFCAKAFFLMTLTAIYIWNFAIWKKLWNFFPVSAVHFLYLLFFSSIKFSSPSITYTPISKNHLAFSFIGSEAIYLLIPWFSLFIMDCIVCTKRVEIKKSGYWI
jgi:hypothetical protein